MSAVSGAPEVFVFGFSRAKEDCFIRSDAAAASGAEGPTSIQRLKPELAPSEAAESAAKQALVLAGTEIAGVQFVISACQTPDFNNPGLVSRFLHRAGLNLPGLEIRQGNCGAIGALNIAARLVQCAQAETVLVLAVDVLSRYFGAELEGAAISQGSSQAKAVMADGAAAFIVSRRRPCRPVANWRFIDASVTGYGSSYRDFFCHLPSSSQFPQRITREDVQQGRHFPVLNTDALLNSIDERVFQDFRSRSQMCSHGFDALISHSIVPAMLHKIIQHTGLKCAAHDSFATTGFIGAAGIPWSMTEVGDKAEKRLLWAAASSGPQWGWAVLERELT